ncbi:MAG: hypothetical protein WC082_00890 [Victivallales bacterium]|jgi:hypothetical protein
MGRFLEKPNIPEFCEGEMRDFILELVQKEIKTIPAGNECRRRELCEAILAANRESGKRGEIRDAATEILKTWKAQGTQIGALTKLGFTITQGKKHYKLRWNQSQYFITLTATPSDGRGGANSASDFNRKFF